MGEKKRSTVQEAAGKTIAKTPWLIALAMVLVFALIVWVSWRDSDALSQVFSQLASAAAGGGSVYGFMRKTTPEHTHE